jgi:hypothetical protein
MKLNLKQKLNKWVLTNMTCQEERDKTLDHCASAFSRSQSSQFHDIETAL